MEFALQQLRPYYGPHMTYNIEAKNVSYKLCSQFEKYKRAFFGLESKSDGKFILKDVNCEARSGEITAIAGPSGAGKTTLLEILGSRISPTEFSGEVLVNSRPINNQSFMRKYGYVAQEDALFPLLTVQETLMYAATLRLPGGRKVAAARVTELMKVLALEHVAASRIGSVSTRGVSGGERRRVSIGVDLVHDPAVVFIDEPTSGLDSASALNVVFLLRKLAVNQGKTVVVTIHQPGFRILELIDHFVLLSNGYVMHNGPLNLLQEKLLFVGHHIPVHVNVLEFAIDMIGSLYIEYADTMTQKLILTAENKGENRNINNSEEDVVLYPNSRIKETVILGQRFCKNMFRTNQLFATRVLQALVAGFVLGTIFLNVGRKQDEAALQTRTGFFAFSLTFLLSSTTEGLPIFLQERRILMSETSKGTYRISSYVLANTLVFLPFLLMVGLLYTIPVYWLVGLRNSVDGFLFYSLVVWMVTMTSNSFVSCFSALVPNFIMGTSVISGLMGSFFLFSGYFISKKNIPSYWIFMHYLSLFKYPFECFMINEYGGKQGRKHCIQFKNGECSVTGAQFLAQQGLKESQKWTNLLVMLGFIVGYRVFCLLILWFRSYRTRH